MSHRDPTFEAAYRNLQSEKKRKSARAVQKKRRRIKALVQRVLKG